MLSKALLGLALAAAPLPLARGDDMGGKIVEAGDTLVSAMMVRVLVILRLKRRAYAGGIDVCWQDEQGVYS